MIRWIRWLYKKKRRYSHTTSSALHKNPYLIYFFSCKYTNKTDTLQIFPYIFLLSFVKIKLFLPQATKTSTDHTEDTEKDFRRMIKTTPSALSLQTSDLRLETSGYNPYSLQYYSFWKAKSHIHNNDFCGLNSWQVELSPCFLSPQFSFSTNCVKYSYNFTWVCIIQWKL